MRSRSATSRRLPTRAGRSCHSGLHESGLQPCWACVTLLDPTSSWLLQEPPPSVHPDSANACKMLFELVAAGPWCAAHGVVLLRQALQQQAVQELRYVGCVHSAARQGIVATSCLHG